MGPSQFSLLDVRIAQDDCRWKIAGNVNPPTGNQLILRESQMRQFVMRVCVVLTRDVTHDKEGETKKTFSYRLALADLLSTPRDDQLSSILL